MAEWTQINLEIGARFIAANDTILIGVAANLCGLALLHLVMVRTVRRRRYSGS